ncbi:tRNA pseudouridine synthase B [Luminiphilus syltensis NOR5-1B]|uniref:tRNA pseudouridine synthase B n=1 Tax=Luminiphilus syltensis NOR5-1B TaxID=565045 RepID=B8KRZ7_9GAMM|nr:tRNA pseudouridine(55) synthase TruB [Luminiphilus syltensis]EED35129.1 tRNA pseudouridine synthase B [Luminiphilus syltensis NOR5-1B]
MARRRRGRAVNGILVLDKPKGVTSNGALQRVKRLFGAAKAGHTGSLDPLATGVLPLCFGEATKVSQFLLDADKAYQSTFAFGVGTATGDAEGDETARADASSLTRHAVEAAISEFRGEIDQVPPMYSALKRDGQPLYKLAREGIEVEREGRRVTIAAFELLDFMPGECAHAVVDIRCSKGTYVRSLAEDLGRALGLPAHVATLRRTGAGIFTLDQALTMEQLEDIASQGGPPALDATLQSMELAITHLPRVEVGESAGYYLRQGQPVLVPNGPRDGMVRLAITGGAFLGIGEMLEDGRVAPKRILATQRF